MTLHLEKGLVMAKKRMYTTVLDFGSAIPWGNPSYITGRVVQLAKMVCSDDGIGKDFPIRIQEWAMKKGKVTKKRIRFKTTPNKHARFMDLVDTYYKGLATESDTSLK